MSEEVNVHRVPRPCPQCSTRIGYQSVGFVRASGGNQASLIATLLVVGIEAHRQTRLTEQSNADMDCSRGRDRGYNTTVSTPFSSSFRLSNRTHEKARLDMGQTLEHSKGRLWANPL